MFRELISRWKCINKNNAKDFASFELEVLHYEILIVEITHPIFKSPWHLKTKVF